MCGTYLYILSQSRKEDIRTGAQRHRAKKKERIKSKIGKVNPCSTIPRLFQFYLLSAVGCSRSYPDLPCTFVFNLYFNQPIVIAVTNNAEANTEITFVDR